MLGPIPVFRYYYHSLSELYQQLQLSPVKDNGNRFPTYEFR